MSEHIALIMPPKMSGALAKIKKQFNLYGDKNTLIPWNMH